jgi:acyl dehydratase
MSTLNPGGGTGPLFLEDLWVGEQFVSGTHRIDAEQIRAFAEQFDPQPFHLDAEAAKATLFEGLVASGWHTAAITMRLLVESGLPIAGGIVGAGGEITWPSPTRPGDVLQVESEVLELRPSRSRPDRGITTVRSETRNRLESGGQPNRVRLFDLQPAAASPAASRLCGAESPHATDHAAIASGRGPSRDLPPAILRVLHADGAHGTDAELGGKGSPQSVGENPPPAPK